MFSFKADDKVNEELGNLVLGFETDHLCETSGVVDEEKSVALALKAGSCVGSLCVDCNELSKRMEVSVSWVAGDLVESPRCVAYGVDVVELSLDLLVGDLNAVANLEQFAHAVKTQVAEASVF